MQHKILKVSFIAFSLSCIVFLIVSISSTNAQSQRFQNQGLCGRVGTWRGVGDSGITWMAVDSPGQNATNGQISLEWVVIDPTLGDMFIDATRVTNGLGVWKKVNQHMYQYSWIAYGLDQNGMPVYTARASGEAELADCDHVNITYVLELWIAGQDINSETPAVCISGTGNETRMPLVQASVQESCALQ